jgi:type I restriction enzyme S subunit
MNVPEGFKLYRHIGLIPTDWKVHNASEVCLKITDGTHDTPKPTKSGIPYIKSIHIKNGRIEFEKCLFLDPQDHNIIYKRCNPQKGDLLIVNIGAGNVGDYAFVEAEYEFSMKNIALLKPDYRLIDNRYLFYYYQSIKDKVVRSTKTGGAQPFLSLSDLKRLKIVTPPATEQKKIAKILSTWDRAIEATEKLLKNSQQQKKALMQQLLTGKKCLPGFSGEWEKVKFEKILDIEIGGTPSRSKPEYWDDQKLTKNRWMSIADLKGIRISDTKEYISDLGVKNSNVTLIPAGTIVMSFKLTIGRRALLDVDSYTNEAICALQVKDKKVLSNAYLFHALNIVDFDQEIDQAVKGKTLNKAKLKRLHLHLPSIPEQQKIASILSAADKEIEILEQKLDCLRQEKKALMQQLLTGKRRVKVDESEAPKKEAARA